MDNRMAGRAALLGGGLWVLGAVGGMMEDLEYNGSIADNPIPDWVLFAVLSAGSALLLFALDAFHRVHRGEIGIAGSIGRAIASAGIGLTIVAIWPFFFFGPFLAGIGLTVYGIKRTRLGGSAAAGAWAHALCFPGGIVAAAVSPLFKLKSGGLGPIGFVVLIGAGFAAMGFSLLRQKTVVPPERETPALAGTVR